MKSLTVLVFAASGGVPPRLPFVGWSAGVVVPNIAAIVTDHTSEAAQPAADCVADQSGT
jgi:hypothetical protein